MSVCLKSCRVISARSSSLRQSRARREVDDLIRSAIGSIDGNRHRREAFMRLISMTQAKTALLGLSQPSRFHPKAICETSLRGLANISKYHKAWKRSPESWQPPNGSHRKVFMSLLQHLFFGHEAPDFFVTDWLAEASPESSQHQRWFVHICATGTIRGTDTPFALSRSAARRFSMAPHHMTVAQALSWAASDATYPKLVKPNGMTRRKWKSCRAAEQQWYASDWKPMPSVSFFRWTDVSDVMESPTWTIRQIVRSAELEAEGIDLNHCVGSYKLRCLHGFSAIFSLKQTIAGVSKRVLTIEVRPQIRRVVTALGHSNSKPTANARRVMKRWAKKNRLSIEKCV